MPNFENDLCNAINSFLGEEGIAYRRKQAKFTNQVFDILVDNPYLAIECKSVNYKKTKKLYFSQHFSDNQIERETEFLHRSNRRGILAIELRRGRGKKKNYALVKWKKLLELYESDKKGISLEKIDTEGTPFSEVSTDLDLMIEYGFFKPSELGISEFVGRKSL